MGGKKTLLPWHFNSSDSTLIGRSWSRDLVQLFKCSLSKEGSLFRHGMKKKITLIFLVGVFFNDSTGFERKLQTQIKICCFFSPKIGNICSINYFLIYSEQTSFIVEKSFVSRGFEPRIFLICCFCQIVLLILITTRWSKKDNLLPFLRLPYGYSLS